MIWKKICSKLIVFSLMNVFQLMTFSIFLIKIQSVKLKRSLNIMNLILNYFSVSEIYIFFHGQCGNKSFMSFDFFHQLLIQTPKNISMQVITKLINRTENNSVRQCPEKISTCRKLPSHRFVSVVYKTSSSSLCFLQYF
jgi:hypothetical protein